MKKLLIALGLVVVVLVAAVFAVRHFAVGYLTPDFVVRYIESQWNCRAEIGSLDIKLGRSAAIELGDVSIGARDDYANAATPLAERPALVKSEIHVKSVQVTVALGDIFKRHLNVEHLLIDQASVETEVDAEGRATIDRLFDEAPMPAAALVAVPVEGVVDPDGAPAEPVAVPVVLPEEDEEFVAADMKVSAQAALIEFRNARVAASIQKNGGRVILDNLQIVLKDIDLDPSNLLGHNSAGFDLSGNVAIEGAVEGERFGELRVSAAGVVAPFNAENGEVEPAWSAELLIHAGSKVDTFPLVEKLQSKLAAIDTGGVDLSDLQLRGELLSDASTRLAFRQGRFTLEQPLSLALPDTTISLDATSWADTGDNQHEVKGVVAASDELTQKIVSKVDQYLEEKLGGLVSGSIREQVLGLAMTDGRIAIQFVSDGDLSDPKVDVVTPFGNLGDLKQTFDGIKDVFKGLFGK